MNNTQLYINNKLLDVSKGIDTLLDYSIMDIRNIKERSNSASYLIELQATDEVRRLFGFPDYITSDDAIELSKDYTARLVDSNTLIVGKIKFYEVEVLGNETTYKFFIVGNNGAWANELSQKDLRALDFWEHSHEWTQANQEASEYPNAIRPYVYPLINNGKIGAFYVHNIQVASNNDAAFLIKGEVFLSDFTGKTLSFFGFGDDSYNTTTSNFLVENDYNGNGISRITVYDFDFVGFDEAPYGYIQIVGGNSRVRVTDRYPIVNVVALFQKIFNNIGYHLESDFLDNTLSKKYIAYNQFTGFTGQLKLQDEFKFRVGIDEDKSVTNPTVTTNEYKIELNDTVYQPNFDKLNVWSETEFAYEPKIIINQSFYFALRFTVDQSMQLQFFVVEEDDLGNRFYQNGVGLTTYNTGTHEIETVTFSNFDVSTTSKIYVVVRFFNSDGTVTFLKGNCRFENRINFTPKSEGDFIHLIQFLPDWTQLDFISAIVRNFELFVMTDIDRRIVYLGDYDSFIDENNIVDWSDKIDASKPYRFFQIVDDKGIYTHYKYEHDSNDAHLNYLKEIFNADYSSKIVSNSSKFKNNEPDEVYMNFAPTYMDFASNIGITSLKLPKISMSEFGDEHSVRILHYDGLRGGAWLQGSNNRYNLPYAFFFDDLNENYDSLSLDDNPNCVGLITKHFQQLINEQSGRNLISAYLNLSSYDLAGFNSINDLKKDFRSLFKLRFRNELIICRINKIIKYDPNSINSTEVEFVKWLVKRHLPTYDIPVLYFHNIQTSYNPTLNQVTVSVDCTNKGTVTDDVGVYITISGIQQIVSQQIVGGQTSTLSTVIQLTKFVVPGTSDVVYFGLDFYKKHYFQY